MALCSTHRYCTCNAYTTGSKGSSGTSTYTAWKNAQRTQSDNPSKTICYGYSDNSCAVYNSKCQATNGTRYAYSCSGHRNYHANGDITVETYSAGSEIRHLQINRIQTAIRNEITQRKAHSMYSSLNEYSDSDVTERDLVKCSQPNNINAVLKKLRSIIYSNSDYYTSPATTYSDVSPNTLTKAQQLKNLENDVNSVWRDCICYSDCTAYGLWKYRTCTCNVNCGCNYSDERLKVSIIYIKSINQFF